MPENRQKDRIQKQLAANWTIHFNQLAAAAVDQQLSAKSMPVAAHATLAAVARVASECAATVLVPTTKRRHGLEEEQFS